jgi:hypothetical protein
MRKEAKSIKRMEIFKEQHLNNYAFMNIKSVLKAIVSTLMIYRALRLIAHGVDHIS